MTEAESGELFARLRELDPEFFVIKSDRLFDGVNKEIFTYRRSGREFRLFLRDYNDYDMPSIVIEMVGQNDDIESLTFYVPSILLYGEDVFLAFKEWLVVRSHVIVLSGYAKRYEIGRSR